MTAERIEACFAGLKQAGRTALVAYLTVGEPSVEESAELALAVLEAGADVLELGVPFSDPTADGPVIAAASHRAIQRGGSLRSALNVSRAIRKKSAAPIVLFTYYNPIMAFGDEVLPPAAADAGCDGLLVVDLPPEEGKTLRLAAEQAKLAFIPLVAPTTGRDREPTVVARARGFVYYVSLTGVTGAGGAPLEAAGRAAAELRARTGLPVVVGFGIDSADKARLVAAQGVDGVVVGTAIVRAIGGAADPASRARAVSELVRALRSGLDSTMRPA
jgi:tryptophan synthase alpha chain